MAMNGSFFNTHRMLAQYFGNAYFPPVKVAAVADVREFSNNEVDVLLGEPVLA